MELGRIMHSSYAANECERGSYSNCSPTTISPLSAIHCQLVHVKMGEAKQQQQQQQKKNKKKNGGNEALGEKKEQQQQQKNKDEKSQLVLKLEMHCEGCTKKVIRYVKRLQGVEDVKADRFSNKVVVFGKVEPSKVQQKLESKTKRKVEIISEPNNKKKDRDVTQTEDESKKKTSKEEKSAKEKKDETGVVVFKTQLHCHCQGCSQRIQKSLSKIKGVILVSVDKVQDLVTVKAGMDESELQAQLKKNKYIKSSVEIVPQKKESGGGNGKKDKSGADNKKEKGGGKKKEGTSKDKDEQGSVKPESQAKMEYLGADTDHHLYPPDLDLFSDENPNACFIM